MFLKGTTQVIFLKPSQTPADVEFCLNSNPFAKKM